MSPSFLGTNFEHDHNEAMEDITDQIDGFKSNGSGWVVDKFQALDLKIATWDMELFM